MVTLESVTITTTRSRDADSDVVSASVALGSDPAVTLVKDIGDVDNGTYAVHLQLPTVFVADPKAGFAFNYLVLNSGHKSWEETNAVLKKVGDGLASAGAKAAASAVGAAIAGLIIYSRKKNSSSGKIEDAAKDAYQTMNEGIGKVERGAMHSMG